MLKVVLQGGKDKLLARVVRFILASFTFLTAVIGMHIVRFRSTIGKEFLKKERNPLSAPKKQATSRKRDDKQATVTDLSDCRRRSMPALGTRHDKSCSPSFRIRRQDLLPRLPGPCWTSFFWTLAMERGSTM